MIELTSAIILVVVLVFIFVACREIVCWYWKINEQLVELKKMSASLELIGKNLDARAPRNEEVRSERSAPRPLGPGEAREEGREEARERAQERWGPTGTAGIDGLGWRHVGVQDPTEGFVSRGKGNTWDEAFEAAEGYEGGGPARQ